MRRRIALFLFLAAFVAFFAGSCTSSQTPDEQNKIIEKHLNEGKKYLEEGMYSAAKMKFKYVIDKIDFANPEAHYGYALSEFLGFADLIRTINGLTSSLGSMAEDENLFIRDVIHDLLEDLYLKFEDIHKNLLFVLGDPYVEFKLNDHVYVYLTSATTPTLDLKGEWDRADAFLLDGIAEAMMGILNFALSIDLRGDIIGAYDYINRIGMDNLNVSTIMNVLVYLLNSKDYPNFLGLDPDGGKERWEQAGLNLATAIQDIRFAFYLSSIETDNQDDDILAFERTKKDGTKCKAGDTEPYCSYESRYKMKDVDSCSLDPDIVTGKTIINIMVDENGNKKPLEMENKAGTACLLQKFHESLDYTDGKDVKIYLVTEILPLIISSVADSGMFDEQTASLLSQYATPDSLKSLLGDPIAFDFGGFFETAPAHGLRDLLPAWDTGDDPDKNFFVIEKECPNDVPGGSSNPWYLRALTDVTSDTSFKDMIFPCDNPSDFAHFSFTYTGFPTITEIPKDGIESKSLYIAFQDPSFNNLLYLNFDSDHAPPGADSVLNPDLLGSGLEKANLYNLNVLLQIYLNLAASLIH